MGRKTPTRFFCVQFSIFLIISNNMKNPTYKKAVVAGGTGYLGTVFLRYAAEQFEEVHVLTRNARPQRGNVHYHEWDGCNAGPWMRVLEDADLVLNLTGKSVNCRYTQKNKTEILESRVSSTLAVGAAVIICNRVPRVWINASTATIYRHAEDRPQCEFDGEIGYDFSMDVAQKWEQTFFDIPTPGTRKVALRTAIVLGNGGALPVLAKLSKWGLGGRQGKGTQKFSWIHELDFVRSIFHVLRHQELEGAVNCCAPHPVDNEALMRQLTHYHFNPVALPTPKWVLEVGALLMGTEAELVVKSRWVLPEKLLRTGFTFTHATLQDALDSIFAKSSARPVLPAPRAQMHSVLE
jgi:uncharacterized protein